MQIPFSEQVTCTVRQFEQHSGLGHTKTCELIKTRRLKTTKVDGRRLIIVASALALLMPADPCSDDRAPCRNGASRAR